MGIGDWAQSPNELIYILFLNFKYYFNYLCLNLNES